VGGGGEFSGNQDTQEILTLALFHEEEPLGQIGKLAGSRQRGPGTFRQGLKDPNGWQE
jgi:hypothetical protein